MLVELLDGPERTNSGYTQLVKRKLGHRGQRYFIILPELKIGTPEKSLGARIIEIVLLSRQISDKRPLYQVSENHNLALTLKSSFLGWLYFLFMK